MELRNLIVQTLTEEVVPAMGCTEPVAVALACAKAKELITFNYINKAEIFVSPNIYKNGLSVGIPNTQEVGLSIAAALGFIGGESKKDLKVLEGINQTQVKIAKEFLHSGKLTLDIKDTASVAVQSAVLAFNNSLVHARNGIVAVTAENTIKNLGVLSSAGMGIADAVILRTMK